MSRTKNMNERASVKKSRKKKGGIRQVYAFTLSQLLKNKANRIIYTIVLGLVLLSVPVGSLLLGDGGLFSDILSDADQAAYQTSVYSFAEYKEMLEETQGELQDFGTRYAVQYAYSLILMIVTLFAITYIIRAINEEKNSKLVEILLVSVDAEDMILGKILAVLTFIIGLMVAIAVTFSLSFMGTTLLRDTSFVGTLIGKAGISTGGLNIGIELIFVVLVSLALAYLLFALISALPAAGASTTEDLQSATSVGVFTVMTGYFAATVALPIVGESLSVIFSLIPVVSAFAAPACYVLGEISWVVLGISWLIQAACIFWLYRVSGRVYDQLIMYKGNRLKMKTILKMAIGSKGVE